jgi:DNA-binding MarR family transcriptional regulator
MILKRPANENAADMLLGLGRLGGQGNIASIQRLTGLSHSTISRAIPGLKRHGYVERNCRLISLTAVGRVAVSLILADRSAERDRHLNDQAAS